MEPLFTSEEVLTSEQWSELLALLSKFLGKEALAGFFDVMGSREGMAALANPATFMHDVETKLGQLLDGRPQPSGAEIETIVPMGIDAIRTVLARELADPASLGSTDGAAFVSYLESLDSQLGPEVVIRTIVDREVSTLWGLGTFHAILSLLRISAGTVEGPFEARVRETTRGIREATERWYKPLLQVTLRLERAARSAPHVAIPRNLGVVMSHCKDLWKGTGASAMLLFDARFIRNADGHADVEVDIPSETIRFTNRPETGPPATLGPWREDQLRASADDLLNCCGRMSFAYARYFFEELGSQLQSRTGTFDAPGAT